eukprot:jgi/Tetstr1/451934/TSEL_038970.t1
MSSLTLDKVTKRYGPEQGGVVAVHGIDLEVADGEFLVLVGPSGCGKSTALRMIAGLEEISAGELRIDGVRMNELDSSDRDIAMVFQNYALYPHMSVYRNIAYPLHIQRRPKAEIDERVRETAKTLQLTEYLGRRPAALSGGQRQRVAMGRALIRRPKAFLMDEPLSNLDAKLRVRMRSEITAIQRQVGITTVYVTHDQIEAVTMGDRVAVMRDGVLQQVATPDDMFWRPANAFVAGFIGSPPMNLFMAELRREGQEVILKIGEQDIRVSAADVASHPGLQAFSGERIVVGIRPEYLTPLNDADAKGAQILTGEIRSIERLGAEVICYVSIGAARYESGAEDDADVDAAEHALVARFHSRQPVSQGERLSLRIDTAELRFFDPETSLAIGGVSQ